MRAAVVTAPGVVGVQQVPVRNPAANEVRVRVESCGVCASNVPPWEGRPWFTYPMEPGALGHEASGFVDAVGADVVRWKRGDRVAYLGNTAKTRPQLGFLGLGYIGRKRQELANGRFCDVTIISSAALRPN